MANTYAANFGDVVKHAVLCEVLVREQPSRYLESHGGRLGYDLAALDPGPGGVWDLLDVASADGVLERSTFVDILRRTVGTRERPGRYPGSIGFAHELLASGSSVVAYELVDSSAADLRVGLAELGREATIEVSDGLVGVCERAGSGDLVLLDPFHVHEVGERYTAAEAFAELAGRGVGTMLWYAIHGPDDPDEWIDDVMPPAPMATWRARLVGNSSEGGLAGCGFLAAHLSTEATAAGTTMVDALGRALGAARPGLRTV